MFASLLPCADYSKMATRISFKVKAFQLSFINEKSHLVFVYKLISCSLVMSNVDNLLGDKREKSIGRADEFDESIMLPLD